MKEIPILLYQNIGDYPKEMMEDGLLPRSFESQMTFLSENGYRVVTLSQGIDHINRIISLDPQSLAITIDGGYRDAFSDVLPILERHNFYATFFIVPDCIGKERTIGGRPIKCLSWEEVGEIFRSGMGIGLLAYEGKSIKNQYDEEAIRESVLKALELMESNCAFKVKYCAFKEGLPEKSLWDFLQALGFQAVLTQCPTFQRTTLAGIGRIQIDDDDQNIFRNYSGTFPRRRERYCSYV